MHHDLSVVQRGWAVYDTNDEKIGDVADIGAGYLLVQKGLLFIKDLYIPESAVTETDAANGRVYLNIAKGDADSMGWEQPPLGDAGSAADRSDFDYGVVTDTTTTTQTTGNLTGDVLDEAESRRLTLHEEELQAQTRRQQAGEVEVSKRVVEEAQELEVPVTHEEVDVRRVRVNRDASATDAAFIDDGETIRVPVTAETVEVTKTPRVVEEIEISKREVTERQKVRDTVRREEADISREGEVTLAGESTGLTADDRAGDLVGAGADRFERTTMDDIAGVGNRTENPLDDTDEGARDIDRV